MYSSEDFEKLWFLYKLEGQSKNISIESFCLQQGVSYTAFSKWFSSRKKRIVPVEIVGIQGLMQVAHVMAQFRQFLKNYFTAFMEGCTAFENLTPAILGESN